MNHDRKKELQDRVASGFLGFWIKNFRLSYLATGLILLLGFLAIVQIPKESMPEVEIGIITVNTVYPGANPEDIDSLITEKIYNSIKDMDGIDTISSTSSLGISSLQISAKTGQDLKDLRTDIQSKVDTVKLPQDARDPVVKSIETNTNATFAMYLFHRNNSASQAELFHRAKILEENLENLPLVDRVEISDGDYEIEISIPNEKLQAYGLTIADISAAINASNLDMPIGNFEISEKSYDYRISGKNIFATDFLSTPLSLPKGGTMTLWEIATIERKFNTKTTTTVLVNQDGTLQKFSAVKLTLSKTDSASVFGSANQAKAEITKLFQEENFKSYDYFYSQDFAEIITTDYIGLLKNFLSTLTLVFIVMLIFVGLVDSIFATIVLPLAFLATFIMLNYLGYSMNMLTNFSLIISLGIAIDTIIVFVQAAGAKIKLGYDPQTAIILSFKEYTLSIIVGTSTTIMVFVPIMSLPGILWRFLAFIPVTIFGVLFFGLLFALTINGALYKGIIRPKKTYTENPTLLEYATSEQKELLFLEREGKILVEEKNHSKRVRLISGMTEKYKNFLNKVLHKKLFRRIAIFAPIIFFFFGFKFIAPNINFELMPADDYNLLNYTIKTAEGTTTDTTNAMIGDLREYFSGFEEIKNIEIITNKNTVTIAVNLTEAKDREKNNQLSVFELEEKISEKINFLKSKWLEVIAEVEASGPPGVSAVGINIESKSRNNFSDFIATAKDFENFIASLPETKNITNSSSDTPGQFVFRLKKDLLANFNIPPQIIYQTISQNVNGMNVGSVKDGNDDIDVILKNSDFTENSTPEDIAKMMITVGKNQYRIGDFIEITPQNSVATISRKDGIIQITIGADIVDGANSITVNQKILDFAKNYPFKENISYSAGGAQSENSDLIISMITALILSLLGIFALLTWQFNSYAKPAMVFFSVFMAIPFVLLGLLITGNPFSMMFGIGFVALMGISVNHGIILLEGVDQNLKKWMNGYMAMIESSSSRLEPMLLTTLTTVLGMIPMTMEGKMWAGFAWTIIFGLMATTFIALFSLSSLYYELFIKEKSPRKNFIKRILEKFSRKRK